MYTLNFLWDILAYLHMFMISQELKDAFFKLEFWEIEYRKYENFQALRLFIFICLPIFYFAVMILDDNMQKLKARCLGNIVVK